MSIDDLWHDSWYSNNNDNKDKINMTENWRVIQDYPDYMVSSLGRVKSFRVDKTNGKILKDANCQGYRIVGLRNEYGSRSNRVHRLVCKAFIPNPKGKSQVNHINGIKDDNYIQNLEWSTPQENSQHSFDMGFSNMEFSKRPVIQMDIDGFIIGEYSSMLEAEMQTGVSSGNISKCARKERNHAGNFIWRFKTNQYSK